MSSRDHLAAVADGAGGSVKARPAGLPEKLMAAIRPEFRADVLVFDPRDPVFGGPPCAVSGCDRPARSQRMCWSHRQRWYDAGKPDLVVFAATTSPDWTGHKAVASCQVAGCRFGLARAGHVRAACRPVEAGGAARPGSVADLGGTVAAAVTAAANLPGSARTAGAGPVAAAQARIGARGLTLLIAKHCRCA